MQEVIYFGHEREIVLDVAGNRLLVRAKGDAALAPGDHVVVGWHPSAGVAVEGGLA